MKKSGITVAALFIVVATSTAAQVSIDEKYLVGTWVGEWVSRGPDPRKPSAVTLRDTLTFRSDGKFVRAIQAADNPNAPTTRQEGTYTITGDTIWIRGTYDGGERAGQTTVYLYDAKVTDESAERAFGFLSQRLKLESKN
jgi:hypothetical protein